MMLGSSLIRGTSWFGIWPNGNIMSKKDLQWQTPKKLWEFHGGIMNLHWSFCFSYNCAIWMQERYSPNPAAMNRLKHTVCTETGRQVSGPRALCPPQNTSSNEQPKDPCIPSGKGSSSWKSNVSPVPLGLGNALDPDETHLTLLLSPAPKNTAWRRLPPRAREQPGYSRPWVSWGHKTG